MGDQRRPSSGEMPRVVRPPQERELPVAPPVPRKQTPIGMPAPPPQHRDDSEQVRALEEAERQRVLLLIKLQEAEQAQRRSEQENDQLLKENSRLQRTAPVHPYFPPPSVPPPGAKPPPVEQAPPETPAKRYVLQQKLQHWAAGVGIFVAIAWNAFNSYRAAPEKIEALSTQQQQSRQLRENEQLGQALAERRNLQALRAMHCWFQQVRGAIQRQGLDLPSLPPGGVTALKLADEDPNRPGPPRFIAKEQCAEFPKLPPDITQE